MKSTVAVTSVVTYLLPVNVSLPPLSNSVYNSHALATEIPASVHLHRQVSLLQLTIIAMI